MKCYVRITALVYELFLLSKRQLRCLKTVLKTRYIAVLPVGLSDWWAPVHSNNHEEDYPHETLDPINDGRSLDAAHPGA